MQLWVDQTNVVGVDAMNDQSIQNLINANKIILEDIISNKSFSVEEKDRVRDRLKILIQQLGFWTEQDNKDRFFYDLKDHVNWMLKSFS